MKRLHAELREIEELKSLADQKGWLKLKRWAIDRVIECEQEVVSLSKDVESNKTKIQYRLAFRDALVWLVNQVDYKAALEPQIQERIKYLAETSHDLEPSEIVSSGVELQEVQ